MSGGKTAAQRSPAESRCRPGPPPPPAAGGEERWVSARAVARRLSPTANHGAVARDLTRLHRAGLIEVWFKGGNTNYRHAR